MTDDLRWAVRYAFLEDLWRDDHRVIVDAGLEAVLRQRSSAPAEREPLDELVDALVPRASTKARTWMAVTDEAVARELAQTRPGTGFLPRGSFADVVAHRDWAVALVELSALDDQAPGGARLRQQLAQRAAEGRTVVVSVRAQPEAEGEAEAEAGSDAGFAALSDLLDDVLGGGRIFGVYRPPMAALVDFGGSGDQTGDQTAAEEADDEVPLSFDNTLGTQAPQFVEYVAVVGEDPAVSEGVTLVELPPHASPTESGGDDALRAQLLQARRQAELAAIDRQALLEKVDELESARQQLEQQTGELRDELARAVVEREPGSAREQLQASQADNQALRWKVGQLERELAQVRARPVEALEAQVAALRAELSARTPDPGVVDDNAVAPKPTATGAPADSAQVERRFVAADLSPGLSPDVDERLEALEDEVLDAAERRRFGAALADLDRLIGQVERGGIGVLPLRQALVSLRRRLQV
ncbi:MAG: hypothetical protein AAGF11_09085 [Myxococcota bacterium]